MSLSHFQALVVFSAVVATVFAIVTKETSRDQLRYGLFVFASFLVVGIALGWIMYPFPG